MIHCRGKSENTVLLLLAGQKIQHGGYFPNPGAGGDAQHSLEHSSGDLQLWKCTGKEQEASYSQGWRL